MVAAPAPGAIRTYLLRLRGAICAKCAFVRADMCFRTLSQPVFISNATWNALLALAVVGKLLCFDCSQILALMDGQ